MDELTKRIAALSPAKRTILKQRLQKISSVNGSAKDVLTPDRAENLSHDLHGRDGMAAAPLRPVAREQPLPLSFAQERLWIVDQMFPGSPAYNSQLLVRLEGSLCLPALRSAIEQLVRRHEALRTRFPVINGEPAQEIFPFATPELKVIDLSGDAPNREGDALRLAQAEGSQLFDLAKGPLVRWLLIRLDGSLHFLRIGMHHIISDGWSQEVIYRELAEFYSSAAEGGRAAALDELPVQYADFSSWQRRWLSGHVLQKQIDYWRSQLAGISRMDFPADRPPAAKPSFRGSSERIFIGRDTLAAIKRLASDEGATLFMALLAAFKTLLQRYTGQDHIAVGSPIANRNRIEVEGVVGFFVNSLVLRTDISGDPTFREALRRVREITLKAYEFQDAPFEKLVEELAPERDFGQNAFFQIMFALQNLPSRRPLEVAGLKMSQIPSRPTTTRFEIEVHLWEAPDGLEGQFVYNPNRFDASRILRMIEHYSRIVQAVSSEPDQRLSRLPMLSSEERQRQIIEWNHTATSYPRERCIHTEFEEQARQRPAAPAVVCGGESVSYRELNRRANKLAAYLRARGVGAGARVGICMERSAEMITGILGILKAGAAYVPLDPSYPKDRLNFMISDAAAKVVLCAESIAPVLAESGSEVISLEQTWPLIQRLGDEDASGNTTADGLAYVIYTSGSTGTPKGVAVPHRAVMRLVEETNYVELGPRDRIAHVSNVCFDAATFEIWGAVLTGGCVVVISKSVALNPRDFSLELKRQAVTTLFLTTALFNELAREDGRIFEGLKQVLFGGEAVNPKWVRHVLKSGTPKRLLHVYGPTECTTFATYYEVREVPQEATTVPIGKPISNTTAYILDRHGNPLPVGVPGELYLGGDGLAEGYLNRTELTLEKFIPDPFSGGSGSRLYRTGDVVKYLQDGNIEFLTRFDDQVKIRGFRIETGEIETVLQRHPAIGRAVVTVWEPAPGEKQLLAYYETKESDSPESADLLSYLSSHLPRYMIPESLIRVEKLPITPRGKIDWRALPKPGRDKPQRTDLYVVPRNAIEEQIAAIWSRLLNVERVGIHDNFFELGGHSLKVLGLLDEVEKRTGHRSTALDVFENPTVAGMAAKRQIPAQPSTSPLIIGDFLLCLRAEGSQKPLFIIPGGAAAEYEMLAISSMLPFLEKDTPVYGVFSRAMDEAWLLPRDLRGQAAAVLKAIQQIEPHGSYVILGLCIASTLAVEIARQAERIGEPPGSVILFDAVAPPRSQLLTACFRGLGFDRLGWKRNTITTPTGDPVPSRIAEYYELLVNWTPAPFHSSLHLLFSSSTRNPQETLKKWKCLAKGAINERYLTADHQSFIREHVAETVAVLNEILQAIHRT
jgi:amino acid adenylation domain-containing protein